MKNSLIGIQISREAFGMFASFYGYDKKVIGSEVSKLMVNRSDRIARLKESRKLAVRVAEILEVLFSLKSGSILERHVGTGRLIRTDQRPIYRNLVTIVMERSGKFAKSDIMRSIGASHCSFTHGVTVVNSLYDCYPDWRRKIVQVEQVFNLKIIQNTKMKKRTFGRFVDDDFEPVADQKRIEDEVGDAEQLTPDRLCMNCKLYNPFENQCGHPAMGGKSIGTADILPDCPLGVHFTRASDRASKMAALLFGQPGKGRQK